MVSMSSDALEKQTCQILAFYYTRNWSKYTWWWLLLVVLKFSVQLRPKLNSDSSLCLNVQVSQCSDSWNTGRGETRD